MFQIPAWLIFGYRLINLSRYPLNVGQNASDVLYTRNQYGTIFPAPNRTIPVAPEEQRWMDQVNEARRQAAAADLQAMDDFMNKMFPNIPNPVPRIIPIPTQCNRDWRSATAPPRRDPLAIDLDGDGIDTIGIPSAGNPILFDHDADGIKTGTGWLKPDDAWLVMDRDGNGRIDSGRELFGVDTLITVTEKIASPAGPVDYTYARSARSGFEALAALDKGNGTAGSAGYGDGVFDARDAAYAQVRLWQDLNQDGISQDNELISLASKNITSIGLTPSTVTTNLGNGNTITGQATVKRGDGTTAIVDSVDLQAGNLNLADNPFFRTFSTSVPLTNAALALPEMGGSGWLRDLRESMSLGTPAADQLRHAVETFSAGASRDAQLESLDALIDGWARTSGKATTSELTPMTGTVLADDGVHRTTRYTPMDMTNVPANALLECVALKLPAEYYESFVAAGVPQQRLNAAGKEVLRRMDDLEAFNGANFVTFTNTVTLAPAAGGNSNSNSNGGGGGSGSGAPLSGLVTRWVVNLSSQQITALNGAYDALTQSIYPALALQSRLGSYLDSIQLSIDESGVHFDPGPLAALFRFVWNATALPDDRRSGEWMSRQILQA